MRHTLMTVLAASLATVAPASAAQPEAPKPLPPKVVGAWKNAGALVGWMSAGEYGAPAFRDAIVAGGGKAGDLPAFQFRFVWRGVAGLPQPEQPFALYLHSTDISDKGLKELAALKNLQGLDLGVTKVTDAGMKELTALKRLRWLKLPATQITDAGLKGVSACKGLETLNLAATRVSDTGLK
jgi:hypothetical protein